MSKTCVLIPSYNEAKSIGRIVGELKAKGLSPCVVDDGSTDDTAKIAESCGAIVLRHEKNKGKGASLREGFIYALKEGFDKVLIMDGDGQHSCDDLQAFIQKAEASNCGIIVGNRMATTKQMPVLRIMVNRFMSGLISLIAGQHIPDTQCGFRLVKKDLLQKVNLLTSKYETESEILIKAARLGFKIESLPVKTIYSGQKSQINPFIDTLRFLRFIILESIRRDNNA